MNHDSRITKPALRRAAFLIIALMPALLRAQFDTATILGTVRDSSGAVVPGVAVTLRNTQTGITANGQSDEQGGVEV